LGVPTFYPLFGFVPTDKETPYPNLLTIPEAWMALELTAGSADKLGGKAIAIDPFMHAHLWDTSQHE
jgi:predicted N-acetyltransferase YhbS